MSDPAPKKSLGQHWLNDPVSLQAMAEAASVSSGDQVLEIGPGLGTLTKVLLERGAAVTAVEFDSLLAAQLRAKGHKNLEVLSEDILKFDFTRLPKDYMVVANIPYYLTSNLLRVLSESANPPTKMALLVQKEVAERVAAGPGSMSLLSLSVQVYNEVSIGMVVPAKLFTPPPKVDSQILVLTRREVPLVSPEASEVFFRVVKAGFSQRRKKLRSSLSGGLRCTKLEAGQLLAAAQIDPDARPQELGVEHWLRLSQYIADHPIT